MQVVVEISSGSDRGRRTLLRTDQRLTVGRTERADFAVPHDGQLSSVHFALTAAEEACYLEDLGSTNGTFRNGAPLAQRVALRHGDVIRAGVTDFTVLVAGAVAEDPQRFAAAKGAGVGTVVHGGESRAATTIPYATEACASGLTRCYGATDTTTPVEVVERLCGAAPLHLILDFNRLDLPRPEMTTPPEFLMDWLPEVSRAQYSPVILSAADGVDLLALTDTAWGKDALIGVYSTLDRPALLRQVRPAAGAFARPSVLAPQLTVGTAAFVGNLLAGIDAVLVEAGAPAEWNLFCPAEFNSQLDALAFVKNEVDTNQQIQARRASE